MINFKLFKEDYITNFYAVTHLDKGNEISLSEIKKKPRRWIVIFILNVLIVSSLLILKHEHLLYFSDAMENVKQVAVLRVFEEQDAEENI